MPSSSRRFSVASTNDQSHFRGRGHQIQILPPAFVVAGEFVLVERAAGLRVRRGDEGVFDAGGPEKEVGRFDLIEQ